MPIWDPDRYLRYADERSRPFFDLVARINADRPRTVVDLGCGPGQLTATLADRWPTATVLGVDSSPQMISAAQSHAADRVDFALGDLVDFDLSALGPIDVITSNATLQWVDDHRRVLPRLIDALAPGGWLAFQVPGNQNEPSHTLLHELAQDPRFAVHTGRIARRVMPPATEYLADLSALDCVVDAWETTYLHVLPGPDAVFGWTSGTGARPYLQALPDDLRSEFVARYQQQLRVVYPQQPYGTVLPFRRIFAVAHKRP